MFTTSCARAGLSTVALLAFCLPAPAAVSDKLLLDDTDFVMTVNVKQLLDSPLFKKNFQAQVGQLLKMEQIQAALKDSGFDPLQDIESLIVATGSSCHRTNQIILKGKNKGDVAVQSSSGSGAIYIINGRFDPTKIEAKLKELGKDMVRIDKVNGVTVYSFAKSGQAIADMNFAFLDKNTLIAANHGDQLAEMIDKATSKKKTELKYKSVKTLLEKLDLKQAINVFMTENSVVSTSSSATIVNGQVKTEVKRITLGETAGIEMLQGSFSATDDLKGNAFLSFKDADKAKEFGQKIEGGLALMIEQVKKDAEKSKEFAPLISSLQSVKFTVKDKTITLQGQGTAQAVQSFIKLGLKPSF